MSIQEQVALACAIAVSDESRPHRHQELQEALLVALATNMVTASNCGHCHEEAYDFSMDFLADLMFPSHTRTKEEIQ